MNTNEYKYQTARKRVRGVRRFYAHLAVYVLVNALLFLINFMTLPDVLWFHWPLLGWGIGVLVHAVSALGLGPDWEENKIQEFME